MCNLKVNVTSFSCFTRPTRVPEILLGVEELALGLLQFVAGGGGGGALGVAAVHHQVGREAAVCVHKLWYPGGGGRQVGGMRGDGGGLRQLLLGDGVGVGRSCRPVPAAESGHVVDVAGHEERRAGDRLVHLTTQVHDVSARHLRGQSGRPLIITLC